VALSTRAFHVGLLPDRPAAEVARLAAEAEALGFAGVWIADSQSIWRDAFAALTLSAAATQRVTLATAVTNPVTRHPAVLANIFATLDEISGGRAAVGIGVGESSVRTLGLEPARLARLEEVVLAVRGLIAGQEATVDGRAIRSAWSARHVPVYIASSGPRSLRLAGRIGDGVLFQVGSLPSLARWALREIAAGAEGRSPTILMRMACAVDRDAAAARDSVAGYAAAAAGTVFANVTADDVPADVWDEIGRMKARYDYYEHASGTALHRELVTDRILDAIAVAGTPDYAVERFRELCELPIDGFVLPMVGPDPSAAMRVLAEDVLPKL
jgi:5,10-methylenetetrahydromethanopterin reductase